MSDPGARRRSRTFLALTLLLGLLASACQSAMSVEEAKKVTAEFAGHSFVPPPRTINDITAILDQQKRADPAAAERARVQADQQPPDTSDPARLADFYHQRGLAAREIGRAKQEIDDLKQAVLNAGRAGRRDEIDMTMDLAQAEILGGNYPQGIEYIQQAIGKARAWSSGGWLITLYGLLARVHAIAGDLEAAEAASGEAARILDQSRSWQGMRAEWRASWDASVATARASVAEIKGQFVEAEAFYREAIATREADPVHSKGIAPALAHSRLVLLLIRQGRLLEAENEARTALLGALRRTGRNSTLTAGMLAIFTRVLLEQGRYGEAEALARATIDVYERTGSAPDTFLLAAARGSLAAALVAQERWQEALAEYGAVRQGLGQEFPAYQKRFAGFFGRDLSWGVALLNTGQAREALGMLQAVHERAKQLLGERHANTPEALGLVAMAHAALGERGSALTEFAEAVPVLLDRSLEVDDETTSRPARDQRLGLILASYIGLLADIKGTPLERQPGVDVAAEAFRLADVARGRAVQRALDASAARSAAKTTALAEVVRKEQDTKKHLGALYGLLANLLSTPSDKQNPNVVTSLRAQIETLRRAREALAQQIEREFPAYAQLVNPKPMTVEQARAVLRPGEALIATYVSQDRTFIWAVPHTGSVAFASAPLGARAMEEAVATLRKALAPTARTLGDIPEFDLTLAHRLYAALLEPVRPGWESARSLLVVAHGPLAQLPLSLLVTQSASLAPESGAIFSNYRAVPWLVRSHAVTLLPSVASLSTLRALPAGDPARRPFIGFGDPYFSREQAAIAAATQDRPPQIAAALATRGVPISLRSSPQTQRLDSSKLARLPRLPDTAEEVKGIALAMNADLTRDVFLGARANEKTVKTLDLSGYRVIAFATHGLVPGDLDGLTQPALALSAPDVADVDGDGVLTIEEILALRLNADWVVLSACNTASGQGAGSEAVSGLGRAFFYAGARALLVSNWPVETTSARALTTDLFRRQQASQGVTRAQSLQQSMTWLIDQGAFADPATGKVVFSYAHPIFWAPFTLVGDGGGEIR